MLEISRLPRRTRLANAAFVARPPIPSGSMICPAHFQPVPKKAATRLWHEARAFDRQTRQKGRHGGAIGPAALQVLHALVFDFLNYATGRLDPSYAAIARKANVCLRTVATALKRLRELGILSWVRRCAKTWRGHRYSLEQDTNAYVVHPATQWCGYRPAAMPPAPPTGTWGDHPPLPDVLTQAILDRQTGGGSRAAMNLLESDPTDLLAAALARMGRRLEQRDS